MTPREAYLAMFSFLDEYYRIAPSNDLGGLLGSLSLLEDGQPADSAIADEWVSAIARAKEGSVCAILRLNNQ